MTRECLERLGLLGLRVTVGDKFAGRLLRQSDSVDAAFIERHASQLASIYSHE
jgi:hypothetical protein